MTQGTDVLHHNSWLLWSALTTRRFKHLCNGSEPQPDLPPHCVLPPWQSPAVDFTVTPLPTNKSQYTTEELWQHAFMAMVWVTKLECAVYNNNGSVDSGSGRTGAAALTGSTKLCARTSDHCFMLQTELVAI